MRFNSNDTVRKDHGLGYNSNGQPFFRNLLSPAGLHDRKPDLASFQYGKCKIGISDIDGHCNFGGPKERINLWFEFKEERAARRFPMGQRLTLQTQATDCHEVVSLRNGLSTKERQPGTMSLVFVVAHPDVPVYDIAECKVVKVYHAHEQKWIDYSGGETLAEVLDYYAGFLCKEAPKSRAAQKFKMMVEGALSEIGLA